MPLSLHVSGKTDKGLVRSGNEDYLHLDEDNHVYAVCDGMGGHQAGEVASMTAAETVLKAFTYFKQPLLDDPSFALEQTLPRLGDLLVRSIRLANRAVWNKALNDPALNGMGTTIVAVALEDDFLSVAHVGDSRAYCLRGKELQPLTRDHSWVAEIQEAQNISAEEASSVVGKNVITRALGVRESVAVDYRTVKAKPGDIFILCSDGLCGFADDDEILDVARLGHGDVDKITDLLVRMANDRGGADNVTVIAIEVLSVEESPVEELDAFTVPSETVRLLRTEDAWLRKFSDLTAKLEEKASESSGTNPLWLVGIFALFVLVVVLIIWFQSN